MSINRAGSPLASASESDNNAVADGDLDEMEADSRWMEGLHTSHTGRKLCDFLGHVNSILDDGPLGVECPIDQAVSFRRVIIHAMEQEPTPFGLPKTLPKFIAMVQLCGERMLLTTNRSQLLQLMAHAVTSKRSNTDAINAMAQVIKYRDENPECSLLLTYSAPFQVDLTHLWWDVRTIRRDPSSLKVVDGEMAYQINQAKPRSIASTSALESPDASATLDKEVEAFKNHITAIDLDIEFSAIEKDVAAQTTAKRVATLEALLARMQSDRKRIDEDHAAELAVMQSALHANREYMDEAVRMQTTAEREHDASLNAQINELAKSVEASLAEVERYKKENDTLRKSHRAEIHASILRKDEEIAKLKAQLTTLDASSKAASRELQNCNRARESELKRRDAAHAKSMDDMERKVAKLQLAERQAQQQAQGYLERMTSLSTAMEGRDSVAELQEHEVRKAKLALRVLRACLHLAKERFAPPACDDAIVDGLKRDLEQAEGKLKLFDLKMKTTEVDNEKLKAEVARRESENAELVKGNAKLEERNEELKNAAVPRVTQDAETMTVKITSETDLKIGELETKCVMLGDELQGKDNEILQLKAELQRAKAKASKKGQQAAVANEEMPVLGTPANNGQGNGYNIVTSVHVAQGSTANAPAMANTDFGHASDIDPAVEHMIANAANAMRVLADMARECSRHKHAAHEGWAQVRALQSYNGYMMSPQPPPQWQMQPHSPNGYHAM
tara:strand:- start:11014 stop:13215 length:2202 start_codon:yes stop_codon:yes gene_type:complete